MTFGIAIEDGSEVLPEFISEANIDTVELYDWQKRAVKYFVEKKIIILEASTGVGKTLCADRKSVV